MESISANGLRIAYAQVGEGPPLVLVHGAASDSRLWQPQLEGLSDEFTVVVCYGAAARPALGAVLRARDQGLKVGYFRLITIWPFCDERIAEIGRQVKKILVPEMNLGQLAREIDRFVSVPVVRVSKIGGVTHSIREVHEVIVREAS